MNFKGSGTGNIPKKCHFLWWLPLRNEKGTKKPIPKINDRKGMKKSVPNLGTSGRGMKKSVPDIREQAVLLTQEHYDGDVMLRADQ